MLVSEVAVLDASKGFGFTSGLEGAEAFFLVALVTAGFAMETFGGLLAEIYPPPPDLLEMKEYARLDGAERTDGKRRGRRAIVVGWHDGQARSTLNGEMDQSETNRGKPTLPIAYARAYEVP